MFCFMLALKLETLEYQQQLAAETYVSIKLTGAQLECLHWSATIFNAS